MHIAIVIPAYNVAALLSDCIKSVLAQTYRDWSVFITDDGSTDTTASVAGAFSTPNLTLLHQRNAGVSAARNRGIQAALAEGRPLHARADALLFLDADDWLAPDALSTLAGTLADAPWAAAACGRYARVALDGSTHLSGAPPQGDLLQRLLTGNLFANGGHLLVRREVIEAAGDFRDDLDYGEDWEYWTRVALHGEFVSVASPRPILFVRERPGSVYLARATDPEAYRPALEAIYANPRISALLVKSRMRELQRQAQSEIAWSIGREMIRHGRAQDGRHWLNRSIRDAPSLKRRVMIALAVARFGPFRPYGTAG